MATIGYEPYEINLPPHITSVEIKRVFMSKTYGGSFVKTFPSISRKFFDRHGMNDFMYMTCDYNPLAPQIPGAPGLFFECCDFSENGARKIIRRVFVRIHD